tara:strand:+ start:1611 stop:2882 length:1272 start_codon:yes stop_codon:yes gene_type:complete
MNLYYLLKKLFPLNRSITGKGFIRSLNILRAYNKQILIKKVKSKSKVFDWKVPLTWEINEAYVEYEKKKIIDFKKNNLHVVNYSHSIKKKMYFKELKKNLHFHRKLTEAIPYVTTYYKKNWGFCINKNFYDKISKYKKKFNVIIKSKFKNNYLNYGQIFIKGKSKKEILFSTYLCHPSMANNELSGPVVMTKLANFIKKKNNYYSYRFLYLPETIGSIAFLSKNYKSLKNNLLGGFVITCVGDNRKFSYIPTAYGDTFTDRIAIKTLRNMKINFLKFSYLERGSDERQYNWPGIDLPISSITRSKYGNYKEYHSSLDDLNFVNSKGLNSSYDFYVKLFRNIEKERLPITKTKCEPFMQKINIYPSNVVFNKSLYKETRNILNFLTYCNGKNEISFIAKKINLSSKACLKILKLVLKYNLAQLI